MFHLQWFPSRGASRGKPGLPGGHGRRLVLLGLLIAGSLSQTGCQSDPCNTCSFFGRTRALIASTFPFRHGCNSCGGSEVVAEGGCVPSGVPIGATAAPVVVTPGTTVTPGPVVPSNGPQDSIQNLEPLPKSNIGPAPIRGSQGSTGSPSSSSGAKISSMSYETLRPDGRSYSSRGENLAHTLTTAPVPAARSAQASSRLATRDQTSPLDASSDHVLDNLPPLDLPSDVTEKTSTPPVAPAAQRKPQAPVPTQAPASDHLSGRSSSEPDAAVTITAAPAMDSATTADGAPGISRFVAVDPRLAAGSVPSPAGLAWLAGKGYKTLVDLRESSDTDLPFIAEASKRGLRYIALPVGLKSIDRAHVTRFNLELAMSEARPLYFFDSDGTRAGALWYIRRIAVDKVNADIARREAEDIGLKSPEFWLAARGCLERQDNLRSQTLEATSPVNTAEPPSTSNSAPTETKSKIENRRSKIDAASYSLPAPTDTAAWHRYTAIMITGLTIPLAYWSRSIVPTILARTLASLPAPARRLKSLPHELDA